MDSRPIPFMIRYLLGELTEAEAATFENEYLSDRRLFDRLSATEAELIDAYIAGELPGDRKARFEEKFLASPGQREKIENARALARKGQRGSSRAMRFVLTGVAAAILIAAVAGYSLVHRAGQKAQPVVRVPVIAAFTLIPGQERGTSKEQTLDIPAAAEIVRLDLQMDRPVSGNLDAVLETAGGRKIQTNSSLPSTGTAVSINVPAAKLPSGVYILTVSAAQTIVEEFSFRVSAPRNR